MKFKACEHKTNQFCDCSCSCVKKPLRNWRRNKNAKQQNVDVSLRNDVANQRILKAPTKVFILVYHLPHTSLVLKIISTPYLFYLYIFVMKSISPSHPYPIIYAFFIMKFYLLRWEKIINFHHEKPFFLFRAKTYKFYEFIVTKKKFPPWSRT